MSDLKDPRVLFAAERTLLAWSRTSLTLMAFGFVVERSGFLLAEFTRTSAEPANEPLIFWVGLAFIALGVFAAIYSSRQYLAMLRVLTVFEFPRGYATKGGLVVNSLVAVLGTILVAGLFFDRT